MVDVPEYSNPEPLEQGQKQGPETLTNLQRDTTLNPVNNGDLSDAFGGSGDVSSVLGNLTLDENKGPTQAIGGDANDPTVLAAMERSAQIANMTTAELDTATKDQLSSVASIESRLSQVTSVAQAADLEGQAAKLKEADEYFAAGGN